MVKRYYKIIRTVSGILIILISIVIGFSFSNDLDNVYGENYAVFNDGWKVDNNKIELPYGESQATFTITNTLPVVYNDQLLVVWVYYDSFEAYIDGKLVQHSKDNIYNGISTDGGKKEIWIHLNNEYSGKQIALTITLQRELYGAAISQAFITTRGEYAAKTLTENIMTMIVYSTFTVAGVVEIIIAAIFLGGDYSKKRKQIFKSLLYAGLFSVFAAQWLVNDCRLPYIVFGHIVGFSILNIIAFLLMPLFFFRMQRYMYEREDNYAKAIDESITIIVILALILGIWGIVNWGDLIYLAQLLSVSVLMVVGYYSLINIFTDNGPNNYKAVSLANLTFVLLAVAALVLYIGSVISNYDTVFLFDLHIYMIVQICLIYRRISTSIKEERELVQTKIYAFSDELTQLGNRRKYYQTIDGYNTLPKNFAIIMIDTNRLKYYNDNLGHEAGDELIIATAKCLKYAFGHFKESNICRIGGDEFAISLIASKREIEDAIICFKEKMKDWKGDHIEGLYAAVGYASVSDFPGATVNDLQGKADESMYKDKSNFYKNNGIDRRGT